MSNQPLNFAERLKVIAGQNKKDAEEKERLASHIATLPDSPVAGLPDSHATAQASQLTTVASHLTAQASQIASHRSGQNVMASQITSEPNSHIAKEKTLSTLYQYEQSLKSRQERTPLNTRIPNDLYDAILELGTTIRANIQEMATEALDDLIFKYTGKRVLNKMASQMAGLPENVLKELSKLELLNLYSQVTKKKVSPRDRKLVDKALGIYHPLLVELGIREAAAAIAEKGGELYSFRYCLNAMGYKADWDLEFVSKELQKYRQDTAP